MKSLTSHHKLKAVHHARDQQRNCAIQGKKWIYNIKKVKKIQVKKKKEKL